MKTKEFKVTYHLDEEQQEKLEKLTEMFNEFIKIQDPAITPSTTDHVFQIIMITGCKKEIESKIEYFLDFYQHHIKNANNS